MNVLANQEVHGSLVSCLALTPTSHDGSVVLGIYSFVAYVCLAVMFVVAQGGRLEHSGGVDMVRGVLDQLEGGYFNYEDYKFPYTWNDVVNLGDFYNW